MPDTQAIRSHLGKLGRPGFRTALFPALALLLSAATGRAGDNDPLLLQGQAFAPLSPDSGAEVYDCRLVLSSAQQTGGFQRLDVAFALRDAAHYARFAWDASGFRLWRVNDGTDRELAGGKRPLPPSLRDGGELIIKLRRRWIEVVANGTRVVRALHDGPGRGRVAAVAGPGFPVVRSARCQKVAPIAFDEDFTRTQEETSDFGVWEPESGDWRLNSVMEDIIERVTIKKEGKTPDSQHIVNPFCLSGRGTNSQDAIIFTGHWFWDDYRTAVSAKTTGGKVGLAFGVRDPDNLWLVRWEIATRAVTPGKLELVRRSNGVERVVADAMVPARTENWYRIEAATAGSRVTVAVDEREVLSVRDEGSVGGGIGLFASGAGEAFFDDVDVSSIEELRLDSLDTAGLRLSALAGVWNADPASDGLAFAGKSRNADPALCLLGCADWTTNALDARVQSSAETAAFGLVFGAESNTDWRCVWRQADGGRLSLTHGARGRPDVIQSVPCDLDTGIPHDMHVDLQSDGLIRCYVDGALELRARSVKRPAGRIGLWAGGAGPTRFSDVRLGAKLKRDWERPVKTAIFADDPYMQGWASTRYSWIHLTDVAPEGTSLYEHQGDFYGAFSITAPLSHNAAVLFGRDEVTPGRGYQVQFTFAGDGSNATATLTLDGAVLREEHFRHGPRHVIKAREIVNEKLGPLSVGTDTVAHGFFTVGREGPFIWVEAMGRELFCCREKKPFTGRAVGLSVEEPLDLYEVKVRRDHVRDYQFERAAAEWLKVGEWKVTNRFACDPRWSHMNGRSKGVAILWNKLAFEGDYTLEYYAGMRMRQGDMREAVGTYYPRVGDINIALCADGRDLFSGYNLILAAWDKSWSERWTQFRREGRVVAQTDRELIPRSRDRRPLDRPIEPEWDPGGRPVHGARYYINIRKNGKPYDVWFDNQPVLSFEDKDALSAGKRLALWTQHNSIVVGRVRICSRNAPAPAPLPRPVAAATGEQPVTIPSANVRPVECLTHPGRHFDFEDGLQGWQPADDDQGADAVLVRATGKQGRYALKLINTYAGGSLRAAVPLPEMDLGRVPTLTFDCAVPPDVRVNLYLKLKSEQHERCYITLAGPDEEMLALVRLGRFEGFEADGAWHSVRFNLADALRRRFPEKSRFILEDMAFGYYHGGYLNAGLTYNKSGASYRIDNVTVASVGPMTAGLKCGDGEGDETAYGVSVSRNPDAEGGELREEAGSSFSVAVPDQGLWFLNVFERGGRPVRARTIPVWAARPLTVKSTVPAPGEDWGGGPITVRFDAATPAQLDRHGLSLTANGVKLRADALASAYDPAERALQIDTRLSDVRFSDGEDIQFALSYRDSLPGMAAPGKEGKGETNASRAGSNGVLRSRGEVRQFVWNGRMRVAADRTPPGPVRLDPSRYVRRAFEYRSLHSRGQAGSYTSAYQRRSPQRYYQTLLRERLDRPGDHAIYVVNDFCGSDMGLALDIGPFNAGRFPLLTFDYCVAPETRVDLSVRSSGGSHIVGLTDATSSVVKLGSVAGATADGTWRHGEFDLARAISASGGSFSPHRYEINSLSFGDWGYSACAPGAWYAIDNVNLVPVFAGRTGFTLSWHASDAGGVAAYSYVWTRKPDTSVDTKPETTESSVVFSNMPEGELYFHIRARDTAGNWGPTSHYRARIDNTPLAVDEVLPADEARSASPLARVRLKRHALDVDLSELQLSINGVRCPASPAVAAFDPDKKELSWDWVRARKRMIAPIPDGQDMKMRITGLRDFAGNVTAPVEWRWHVDYHADTEGPGAPRVTCWSQHPVRFDDFSEDTASWAAYSTHGSTCTAVERVSDPDSGEPCLRIGKIADGGQYGARAHYGRLKLADFSVVTFDYRIPPGMKANMIVYVGDTWRTVQLTGDERLTPVGRVHGIRADGKWRHATVDLPQMLRAALPKAEDEDLEVKYIIFGSWSPKACPVGNYFFIDNFAILRNASPLPELSVSAVDPTGIRGYAWEISRSFNTQPRCDAPAATSRITPPAIDGKGLWFIHVRAQDGAGNWGRTVHYPYYCIAPVPAGSDGGLESTAKWDLRASGERTVGRLERTKSSSGTNEVLAVSLRTWQADTVRIRQVGAKTRPDWGSVEADVFNQGRTPVAMAAYVITRYGEDMTVVNRVEIPCGEWVKQAQFEWGGDAAHEKESRCVERGFLIYAPDRARSSIVIDNVQETNGGT